jgi:N-acetylmuramoyl-L-alanine amidase
MHKTLGIIVLTLACVQVSATDALAQTAAVRYSRALGAEKLLRDNVPPPTLKQYRTVIAAYEGVVRRFPASAYSDNALWQAANLSLVAFERFGDPADERTAMRLLDQLRKGYPSSSLIPDATALMRTRETAATSPAPAAASATPVHTPPAASEPASRAAPPSSGPVTIRQVRRTELPNGVRIMLELDAEVPFHSERIENPARVFFDLKGATAAASLLDSSMKFNDDLVREVRFGRHPGATRVVMDLSSVESYTVFTLYEPFRLIVDFKRAAPSAAAREQRLPQAAPIVSEAPAPAPPPKAVPAPPKPSPAATADSPAAADAVAAFPAAPTPSVPAANSDGKFSLSRQLGLGVSRVVLDAGHGGHDPGARANGVSEAELTLDVALRLQKLLEKQGVEVIMTRSTDVFIPLEERTRIANRAEADLFLSIHANASRNSKAHGVETYFLNFATSPDAEAVAARENAGSVQSMHKLPEIVRAITLNNKIDESRDFAEMVQKSMVRRLSTRNRNLRDIGVKQAPFVVLIGASMPSVLAEMSFVTNKQEAGLLKTGAYRQHIAEALLDGIVKYQQSLKRGRSSTTALTR